MIYAIGGVPVELKVIASGFRSEVEPLAAKSKLAATLASAALDLSANDRVDLAAFESAGWRFDTGAEPALATLEAVQHAQPVKPGLLASQEGGGLLVLRNRLLVFLTGHPDPAEVLERYPPSRQWPLGANSFEVEVPPPISDLEARLNQELSELENLGVKAELSPLYHLGPPIPIELQKGSAPQWQWDSIRLEQAWEAEKTKNGGAAKQGAGTRTAVIDLGFFQPPKLLWKTSWKAQLDEDGFYLGEEVERDEHGTFCAGLIGGRAEDFDVSGVAPAGEIILVAIPESGVISQVGLKRAIELCFTGRDEKGKKHGPGADVISCSLSASAQTWPLIKPLRRAIRRAFREGRSKLGTPIAWATRNVDARMHRRTVQAYRDLLTVSACDQDGKRSSSEYGKGLDLLAPGKAVGGMYWEGKDDFGYTLGYGASYATACTAGVLALIVALRPDLGWRRVTKLIENSAARSNARWDPDVGWGTLDAAAAVTAALAAPRGP